MPTGLLRVEGSLDVRQFWPEGGSDADTTKVVVDIGANAFQFRLHPGTPFQVTHAFDSATVKGTGARPAIQNGQVVIRLQGIDAPELHYRPMASSKATASQKKLWKQWNHEFRQPLGEAATLALAAKLKERGAGAIPCRVESFVDRPDDVFDTYGRLVGDVVIPGDPDLNVNMWLAVEGWAFPTFYASMSPTEIEAYSKAAQQARVGKAGVWRWLSKTVRAEDFDWNLVYRGRGATPDPGADHGKVLLPKMFRRLSTWAMSRKAKMFTGTFGAYLVKHPDELHLTADFLTDGPSAAPVHKLSEFVAPNGSFVVKPDGLVFRESSSRLVGPGGAPVTW